MSVEDTQPLITHLIELRKRLLNCIIAVIVIFLCLVYFANDIYHLVSAPLIKQLPQGSTMIATDVASPFFTPIKLTFMVSLILSAPVILYQVWAFIAPALYKHERRLVVPLLVFTGSSCSVRRVAALSRAASRITRYWLVSVKMVETMRWP